MLTVTYTVSQISPYAECLQAEYCHAECRYADECCVGRNFNEVYNVICVSYPRQNFGEQVEKSIQGQSLIFLDCYVRFEL